MTTGTNSRDGNTIANTERVIGEYGSGDPVVLITAGLHGNEPAGIEAARRVFEGLHKQRPPARGRAVAIAGNLEALARNTRFVDADLNRMWHADGSMGIEGEGTAEARERREVLDLIERETSAGTETAILIDVHSTSARARPFCIIGDTLANRRIAFALPIPVILGLEESIPGTIQDYFGEREFITAAIEGGQHGDPVTADRLESALWLALVAAGVIDAASIPDIERHHRRLAETTRGLPRVIEIFYRHGVKTGDGFKMEDGLHNFVTVERGQRVATDHSGGVIAPERGMVMLPNYQGQGDDGFFLGRRVRRLWLRVSTLFRHLRIGRLLPLLPGVRRHPDEPRALVVDPSIARWKTLQVFHLCGFRRWRDEGRFVVFRRRPEGGRL